MKTERTFAVLLQAYFTERLVGQRNASPHPIASHRDTFRLLLSFAQKALKKAPADLALSDLDAPFIGRFLNHVEKDRGNKPQTRNVRLAAIHSFFHYVALQEPGLSALAQRVLTIPSKRHKTKPVDCLTREEINALVAAPDPSTWAGRRDRTLLLSPYYSCPHKRPPSCLAAEAQRTHLTRASRRRPANGLRRVAEVQKSLIPTVTPP